MKYQKKNTKKFILRFYPVHMIKLHPTNHYKQTPQTAFKGLVPVSYVVVDGHIAEDENIADLVTKQLIKQLKSGKSEDRHLREQLGVAHKESTLARTGYFVKKMGKYLITGDDAVNLNNIWAFKDTLQNKNAKASKLIRELFSKKTFEKLTIHASSINVKGKVKYIVNNLFSTIY